MLFLFLFLFTSLFVGANFSEEEMLEVVNQLDADGSGIIEENEFIDWWVHRSMKGRLGGGLIAMKLRKLARKAAQIFYTDIFTAVWNNDIDMVKTFLANFRSFMAISPPPNLPFMDLCTHQSMNSFSSIIPLPSASN